MPEIVGDDLGNQLRAEIIAGVGTSRGESETSLELKRSPERVWKIGSRFFEK